MIKNIHNINWGNYSLFTQNALLYKGLHPHLPIVPCVYCTTSSKWRWSSLNTKCTESYTIIDILRKM